MKNKLLLYLCILSVGIIITFPTFTNTHALDSFCNICVGYKETASWFLENGKLFSALLFLLYNLVNLPFDSMSYICSFGINIFLSLSAFVLFKTLKNNLNKDTKVNALLLIGSFLIFYNPLIFETFMLDEGVVISLGIFLVTLSAIFINKKGFKNYLLATLFSILGVICYQGVMCYLIPITLIILLSEKELSAKKIIKNLGIALIIYGLSFLVSLLVIKMLALTGLEINVKFGKFNILTNLSLIVSNLLPTSLKDLFGFTNVKIYYTVVAILLLISFYHIWKNKKKNINISMLILLVLLAIVMPFVPNLFVVSDNYTAARMAGTLGILPSIILIFMICRYDLSKNILYSLGILILIILILNTRLFIQNGLINIKRYKQDLTYFRQISERITWYENETGNEIKTIYFTKDTDVAYYYSFGNSNGTNIRVGAKDWTFKCGFVSYTKHKYIVKKMSEEKYSEYFKDKNYDEFDSEQLIFDSDKLYLLIY